MKNELLMYKYNKICTEFICESYKNFNESKEDPNKWRDILC